MRHSCFINLRFPSMDFFNRFHITMRAVVIIWTVLLVLAGGFRFYWATNLVNTTDTTIKLEYTNPMAFMDIATLKDYLNADSISIIKGPGTVPEFITIAYTMLPGASSKLDPDFIKKIFDDFPAKPTTTDDFSGNDESSGVNLVNEPVAKPTDRTNLYDDIKSDNFRIVLRPEYVVSTNTCELEKYKQPFFLTGCAHLAVAYVMVIIANLKDITESVQKTTAIGMFIYAYVSVGLIVDLMINYYLTNVVVCQTTSPYLTQFHIAMKITAILLFATSFVFICQGLLLSVKNYLSARSNTRAPPPEIAVSEPESIGLSVVINFAPYLHDSTEV